jgi:hypothetical protein
MPYELNGLGTSRARRPRARFDVRDQASRLCFRQPFLEQGDEGAGNQDGAAIAAGNPNPVAARNGRSRCGGTLSVDTGH